MGFPVKLFTIKGNLVFMNNLYHKFAITSVCTALGFGLGANQEAYSATFSLQPTTAFVVRDSNSDGLGDLLISLENTIGIRKAVQVEDAEFAEFNLSFPFTPNTVVNSAVFYTRIATFEVSEVGIGNPGSLGIFGYVGNGRAETSDFEAGTFLSSVNTSFDIYDLAFDVTQFLNQRVRNADAFAGFGIRALNLGNVALGGYRGTPIATRLIVETTEVAEPVPEPTTIFGSAIGLCLGGWLKRKKSSPQHKTASQD
jgi:hypothetical protein